MHYLYYCNSSYQLINVLNLHWHRSFSNFENINDYSADLIILNAYNGATELAEIIKEKGIFNNVEVVNRVKIKGSFHLLKTIRDIIFPTKFLIRDYNFNEEDFKNKYDVICTSKFNRLVEALWQTNSKSSLQIHEDGFGAYIDTYDNTILPKSYRVLYRIMNHGKDVNSIEAIYLNELDLYKGNRFDIIREIPKLNENYKLELLKDFRDFSMVEQKQKNIFWLAQIDYIEKNMNMLLEYLSSCKENVVYCPHPRNNTDNVFNFDVCIPKQIWELKILNMKNINDICLISAHSTALFSPFTLYGKEPFIIFTYRMIKGLSAKAINKYDNFSNMLIKQYNTPEKIMIPNTIEEFKDCILKYKYETRSSR